ncbi:aminotransferase class V-fold PLP-dependent enzyme [Phyllobacterium myrsinacearum]|uniref:Aminotransferase n=1 Tax=Phyllobacterium myrsinacearum TaxID=28101 RepID=A0A2S9JF37_9HYPH|nr:aminotransferase class V-fold PLP-dependent enzyme [Phyllobacterium myrsinacearum]PRD51550.1 aminotransferase [Phyllobacterium myrsinacearum]PWV89597.1 selenocysteine lyase/cysteine desulfurase [Phyllobacterium myrsinacearum]RZU99812.1 selenocysteine lyase/cysteine desulfurase [Phyllobacterium myrsinacearum]
MIQTLDIEQLRAQTPGCAISTHFNHSGSSLPSNAVLAAVTEHLQRESLYGPMEAAANATGLVDEARADAAGLIGAMPAEIAFSSSGSAAWGLAFAALPPIAAGDRILVGRQEWGGNLSTMQAAAKRAGARIETIPVNEDGSVNANALAAMIDDRVRLVALTWLPANGGLINDAAAIGKVTRAAGIPYFIDAAQALGQLPVDVAAIGCDMLKGSGRKFLRGPRGAAILYLRKAFLETLEPAYLDVLSSAWGEDGPHVRTDAQRFETSEKPIALLLGLGAALKQARSLGVDTIRQRIRELSGQLRDQLAAIPGVAVHDLGTEKSGLVSFTVAGIAPQALRGKLAQKRITIAANGIPYTPLDMTARGLSEIARASVSYLNTTDEIDHLCGSVAVIARQAA